MVIYLWKNKLQLLSCLYYSISLESFAFLQFDLQNIIQHLLSWKIVVWFCNSVSLTWNLYVFFGGRGWEFSAICDSIRNDSRKWQFLVEIQAGNTSSFHRVTSFPWVTIKRLLKAWVGVVTIWSLHTPVAQAPLLPSPSIFYSSEIVSLYW